MAASSASSPSLRARESVVVPMDRENGASSAAGGGNVRVVVRVRGFLPRGMLLAFRTSSTTEELRLPCSKVIC